MATNVVSAQFEIGDDSKGLSRATAFLLAQQYANSNVLVASATYTRESGTAFLVLVTANGITVGDGTNTEFRTVEVEIEDQAVGIAQLSSQILAAAYAGFNHIISFNVFKRDSGIAFAVAILSN